MELVVLLIVCVGINTGSTLDQPGESATNTKSSLKYLGCCDI